MVALAMRRYHGTRHLASRRVEEAPNFGPVPIRGLLIRWFQTRPNGLGRIDSHHTSQDSPGVQLKGAC